MVGTIGSGGKPPGKERPAQVLHLRVRQTPLNCPTLDTQAKFYGRIAKVFGRLQVPVSTSRASQSLAGLQGLIGALVAEYVPSTLLQFFPAGESMAFDELASFAEGERKIVYAPNNHPKIMFVSRAGRDGFSVIYQQRALNVVHGKVIIVPLLSIATGTVKGTMIVNKIGPFAEPGRDRGFAATYLPLLGAIGNKFTDMVDLFNLKF